MLIRRLIQGIVTGNPSVVAVSLDSNQPLRGHQHQTHAYLRPVDQDIDSAVLKVLVIPDCYISGLQSALAAYMSRVRSPNHNAIPDSALKYASVD